MRNLTMAAIRRRTQRGLSLIEAAMVLALAALFIAGVLYFFQNANSASNTNTAMGQLANIQQATRSLYAGQPNYSGLTTEMLAESKLLPGSMVKDGKLWHAFTGRIYVEEGEDGQSFTVKFDRVPADACSKMTTMDLGTGMVKIDVVSSKGESESQDRPLTPSEANKVCGSAANSTITWTFY